MVVNTPDSSPYDNVEYLGVALKQQFGGNQNHIGILYKPEDALPAMLLHLAFHHRLQNDIASGKEGYIWLDCGLHPLNKSSMSAYCALLAKNNPPDSISYGFDLSGKCFDPITAKWQPSSENTGLTCATFIVEIFDTLGHKLIDLDTWPQRDEDQEWQKDILNLIKQSLPEGDPYIRAQMENIGNIRIRPEEAGASIACDSIPIAFDECMPLANQIQDALRAH